MACFCEVCILSLLSIRLCVLFCRLCCKQPTVRPDFPVICIGLTRAGKTTLLCLLAGETTQDIEPTSGFLIKAVQFKRCILNIKEIGGGEKARQFWKHYYSAATAVVYVIDSSCSGEEWSTTLRLLHEAAHNEALRSLPWLVLASCQDKENARNEKQVDDIILCDGNYGVGAYGMELVHDIEPERSQIREDLQLDSVLGDRKWILQLCSSSRINDARSGFEELSAFIMEPDENNTTQNNAESKQTSPGMTRL